jgi:3-oxoacyl-[acyl-carrier-protein] synthase III
MIVSLGAMGTTIEAVAVTNNGWRQRRGGRKLADAAAQACLHQAGLAGNEVDLLINVGIYHERDLSEPALAALIQEDIDANPEDPHESGHGTFSFDIAHGSCGFLTALQVADGFLHAGTIRHALLVGGDANPGHRMAPDFPFESTGAALLCGWDERAVGIVRFRFETEPSEQSLFAARVAFERRRNLLRIEQQPGFEERAAICAAKTAAGLLADARLTTQDIDLVVANPLAPAFIAALRECLGVASERVVAVDGKLTRAHTAGLAIALNYASELGRLAEARTTLLVSGGAGITAGAALLRNASESSYSY